MEVGGSWYIYTERILNYEQVVESILFQRIEMFTIVLVNVRDFNNISLGFLKYLHSKKTIFSVHKWHLGIHNDDGITFSSKNRVNDTANLLSWWKTSPINHSTFLHS